MWLEQMPGYSLPTLAVWPQPWYEAGIWQMYDLKLRKDGSLKWYKAFVELETKHVKSEVYDSYELAVEAAIKRNTVLSEELANLDLSISEKESLLLKIEKDVTRQSNAARLTVSGSFLIGVTWCFI
ncbi:hypothetical protein K8B83_02035 [Shewanella inventionis]|uniref:hypothetical protein n=1 Tax=Shewanella inventionis TaxID=1738770 RepID=UPI001CBC0AE0|nr:hypothetical protein [Shewanella inventionis]UAL43694.1 hypothetical protein K8B83_02035 [Shewanella inventionis]